MANTQPSLEKRLADLETIVDQMESGDLPLEKSLKLFEKGIKSIQECQKSLTEAEQRVKILMESPTGDDNDN